MSDRERYFLTHREKPGFWLVSRYGDHDCVEGIFDTRDEAESFIASTIEFRSDQNEMPDVLVEDHRRLAERPA